MVENQRGGKRRREDTSTSNSPERIPPGPSEVLRAPQNQAEDDIANPDYVFTAIDRPRREPGTSAVSEQEGSSQSGVNSSSSTRAYNASEDDRAENDGQSSATGKEREADMVGTVENAARQSGPALEPQGAIICKTCSASLLSFKLWKGHVLEHHYHLLEGRLACPAFDCATILSKFSNVPRHFVKKHGGLDPDLRSRSPKAKFVPVDWTLEHLLGPQYERDA